MSQLTNKGKLITRFEIGFDNETKADIDALKAKIDELTRALSVKNDNHGDRLLAAMQAEAANDAPVTYSPWENDLKRATVNDVDYLSGRDLDECVPNIDDVLDQPNWLSESAPQITQADMQLIFIKNLSECLIQRMHSMNRFSEDDYAIGDDDLMPWDIVIGQRFAGVGEPSELDHQVEFAIVTGKRKKLSSPQHDHFDVLILSKANVCEESTKIGGWASIYHETNDTYRVITEAELPAFRAALEACYA